MEKASFNHMPVWLTLAQQVQTPYHARVLKNTCKQVMSFVQRLKSMANPVQSAQCSTGSQTDQYKGKLSQVGATCIKLLRGCSVSANVGLISALQTRCHSHGKKQPLYHIPGWLTLAEPVQTPHNARMLKNTC